MQGKVAYTGSTAANYESDRISDAIWEKEQQYIAGFVSSLTSGDTVLDIPVGTGRFFPIYAAHGIHIIAADISADMLDEAKKKLNNWSSVEFRIEDVEKLSLADGACDHIVCWRLMHLLPPDALERAIVEFARVARKTVLVQFFYLEQEAGIFRKIARKCKKMLAGKRSCHSAAETQTTPWSHIQVFTQKHKHIVEVSRLAGLRIEAIHSINDEKYPETIYVFSKITK